jgi:A/G-specific adenine glycosylase
LRELPGFGRYTAAAVASLAFGEKTAVLDGNVARVLSRLVALVGPAGDRRNRDELWLLAEKLLDPERPGAFNESMMELGAVVCTPRNPACGGCPVSFACAANRIGLQEKIPAPKIRAARRALLLACAVAGTRDGLVLARRAERGLFGGLWELPSIEVADEVAAPATLRSLLGTRTESKGQPVRVERTLTHRELRLLLYRTGSPRKSIEGYVEQRFFLFEGTTRPPMSSAMASAVAAAQAMLRSARPKQVVRKARTRAAPLCERSHDVSGDEKLL